MMKKILWIAGGFSLIIFLILSFYPHNYKTDTQIKYQHHRSYKEFIKYLKDKTDTIQSDFQKTSYIRKKIAEIIDYGWGTNEMIGTEYWNYGGERFYNIFLCDSSSAFCGETSFFLKNVYQDMGYQSTTYDMGEPGNKATHQPNLVFLNDEKIWSVQDAYFNTTVTYKNGMPIDFFDLIFLLKQRQKGNIIVKQDEYDVCPDYLLKYDFSILFLLITNNKQWTRVDDDYIIRGGRKYNKTLSCRYFDNFISNEHFKKRYFSALKKNNLPEDFLYLYLLPIEHNEKWILNKIDSL